jgi:hypothetical protein
VDDLVGGMIASSVDKLVKMRSLCDSPGELTSPRSGLEPTLTIMRPSFAVRKSTSPGGTVSDKTCTRFSALTLLAGMRKRHCVCSGEGLIGEREPIL